MCTKQHARYLLLMIGTTGQQDTHHNFLPIISTQMKWSVAIVVRRINKSGYKQKI